MAADFSRDVHCILGLPFDAMDMVAAVRHIQRSARERRPCFLSTPNLNWLIGCRTDVGLRASVVNSDLSVVDGMPLVWIAQLLGIPILERVSGAGLFEALRSSTSEPLSVYFFGGADGVAESACRCLNDRSSGLRCVGFESPGYGSIEDMSSDVTIARINASGADFLLVALGAKRGQAWIEHNRARIRVPVISHLGATVNFAAGMLDRAPKWMQDAGLEWLWRIKEEPFLWRRYLQDGLALLALVATRVLPYSWFLRRNRPNARQLSLAAAQVREEGQECVVELKGAWIRQNLSVLRECFSKAALAGKNITLEMKGVSYVDSAFVGLVMLLHGHQLRNSKSLRIVSLQELLRKVVKYCGAEYLLSGQRA